MEKINVKPLPKLEFCYFHGKNVRSCEHKDNEVLWKINQLVHWSNCWGDFDNYQGKTVINNKIQVFGDGYNEAMKDTYKKIIELFMLKNTKEADG